MTTAALPLFDSHCHLDDPDADSADVLRQIGRLRADGWLGTAVAGYGPERFAASRQLCAADPGIVRAVGLHPFWLAERDEAARQAGWQALLAELERPDVVAVGEIGLDRGWRDRCPADVQIAWFERGLRLAAERGLPLVLHIVGWHGHALQAMRRAGVHHGGVVHRYSGPPALVAEYQQLGLHVGLSLEPRENPEKRAETARAVDPDRLVVESDWPFRDLTYAEACRAVHGLIERIASWRREDASDLAARLVANARALYRTPPSA